MAQEIITSVLHEDDTVKVVEELTVEDGALVCRAERHEFKPGTLEANEEAVAAAMDAAVAQLRSIKSGSDAMQARMDTLIAQAATLASGSGTVTRAQFTSLVNGVRSIAEDVKLTSVGVEKNSETLTNLVRYVRGDFNTAQE
jgi:hypothetical protein